MKEQASHTAFGVLAARSIYSVAPLRRKIIHDDYAAQLLPRKFEHLRLALKYAKHVPFLFYILHAASLLHARLGISSIALRHRYIDEQLLTAYDQGFRQVVLLGAGFDSRAHRLTLPGLKFIEIDHPQTQIMKQQQLAKLSLPINSSVDYIAVDFMQDWQKKIKTLQLIQDKKTIFIWEGVSYYLDQKAVIYTLNALQTFTSQPSLLIFDCLPKEIADSTSSDVHIKRVQNMVASLGEPMLWGCDTKDIPQFLASHGYTANEVITLAQYAQQLQETQDMVIEKKPWQDYMYVVSSAFNH